MIGWIIQIVLGLLKLIKPQQPPTVSQVQEKIDEVQIKASAAGDVAARSVDTDDKLRDIESHDPANRDRG